MEEERMEEDEMEWNKSIIKIQDHERCFQQGIIEIDEKRDSRCCD